MKIQKRARACLCAVSYTHLDVYKRQEDDSVLFLLSGGGSARFEQPLIPAEELADITRQLLACGANIVEMLSLIHI